MNKLPGIAAIIMALSGCSNAAGDMEVTKPAPDTSDGMIVCAMHDFDGMKGLTLTQTFIILDDKVKRYTQFDNTAFDLCEPGQEGCKLGIEDGAIVMDHLNEEGIRSQYKVDLAAMTIEPRKTPAGGEEKLMSFAEGDKCTREPLPGGMTIK